MCKLNPQSILCETCLLALTAHLKTFLSPHHGLADSQSGMAMWITLQHLCLVFFFMSCLAEFEEPQTVEDDKSLRCIRIASASPFPLNRDYGGRVRRNMIYKGVVFLG